MPIWDLMSDQVGRIEKESKDEQGRWSMRIPT